MAEQPTDRNATTTPTQRQGAELIRAELATLPHRPGVYRMIDAKGNVLYVGKAKNLRKRVAAYRRPERLGARMARVVAATRALEIVTTRTEAEALLLESNLIKRLKPRYNVLLRDDKSFPFIMITRDQEWPQITKHRGARQPGREYFGPFASAGAVNATLAQLARAFPLRSCSDAIFESRTRPCLQYQIKRCTAPCVGRIPREDYLSMVEEVREFLRGKSRAIQDRLADKMRAASHALDFEAAAVYRDRIQALTRIQGRQDINLANLGDADVIALYRSGDACCVQVFFFRAGQNFGNRAYFPAFPRQTDDDDILESFIGQFYAHHMPPSLVLLNAPIPNPGLVAEALGLRAKRKVTLSVPRRGSRKAAVAQAAANAEQALSRRLAENASQRRLLDGVAKVFGLAETPQRIEAYDNSHIGGTGAIGAMVVAGPDGFIKNAYRKYNIRDEKGTLAPGDDYGMLREVLTRRFSRALKDEARNLPGQWPDLLLIDGGQGQLSVAEEVFADLGIDGVALAAIAKGPDRNAGRERFFLPGRPPFSLDPRHPVLYFLQRLRDEAHRFAIGGHRAKRSRAVSRSELDRIPGIGSARKRALLNHFGAARAVEDAAVEDLAKVGGISGTVAQRIYDHFHDSR
ncbi:MAG: excinuclease ABC subunit UvrC [Alphaproteobacteria bacterium]|nr:excinuclease ABC subunit UvrC [Alphaproteobacteria bacterium]MCZ6742153.1 excinuclease ABC subunit UvrC [Alphaproteobacteria bacterium]MCZ6847389.1 excinuclease ABC subunit UvrC [Alphaproteobacteria bacterium]